MSLRTIAEDIRYQKHLYDHGSTPLNGLPAIKEWYYWKLVAPLSNHNKHNNDHAMIVLKRKCNDVYGGITNYELSELWRTVLPELDNGTWHYFHMNFQPMKSVDDYVHFHVKVYKKKYAHSSLIVKIVMKFIKRRKWSYYV